MKQEEQRVLLKRNGDGTATVYKKYVETCEIKFVSSEVLKN